MTVAYIRTYDTSKLNAEAQKASLITYADLKKIKIGKWVKEAGNSNRDNRRIENLVSTLAPGDQIIVSDISKVSRKIADIIHSIILCMEHQVTLHSINEGYVFESNLDSKVLAFTFELISDIEHKLVSMRTKEALALIRSKGVVLGRPKGSLQMRRLEPHKDQIEKELSEPGMTYAMIAEKHGVSLSSLKRFLKENFAGKNKRKKE